MDLTRPLLVLALAAPSLLLAAPAHAACDVSVQNPYSPANKTVAAGTVVTWCWTQSNHSVTADDDSFTSGVQNSQATYQHAITATVSYHCEVHPSMHGTITVASGSPSPTKSKTPTPTPTKTTPPPTHSPTPTRTPSPTPTTASPTTTPPPATTSAPPTTLAPSTVEPTTVTPTAIAPLDPPQAKPKTGVAIAVGSLVAVGALGGAVWLFLRGRTAV